MTARRPLMVLGCTSSAGKSLMTAGLCRWFARQGVRVAPFKAQNMSNNARVVAGGEIGVAQWVQAIAARVEPDVRMNPVLIKPEADTQSQVVIRGVADLEVSARPWEARHDALWEPMRASFDSLRAEFDLIVMEGAGSPAEINLRDQVNNRMVEHADASAVLVSNIDLGGSFAHLYGTWALVPEATRQRLRGFVLNQFRGDAALLAPAPERLTEMTGMGHLGTVPMIRHDIPDEEGGRYGAPVAGASVVAGIARFPFGSNLDEFHALSRCAHVRVIDSPAGLDGCDIVVLPGSKHVAADLAWLRSTGLADAVIERATAGGRVLGVCGGAMMLGRSIVGAPGVDGSALGLGLLPLDTAMDQTKIVQKTTTHLGGLPHEWAMLDGCDVPGYEIRHGRVHADPAVSTADERVWAAGNILATTVHGCFEAEQTLAALTGIAGQADALDASLDTLADVLDESLDHAELWRMVAEGR